MWVLPQTSKRVLIAHPENLKYGKRFGVCHGYKVCPGAYYLNSFIGDNESRHNYLKERTHTWERNIHTIR